MGEPPITALEPHVPSAPLRRTVRQRLSELHQAVANRDATVAYGAANAVLDLVDQLEKQFGQTCDARP